jgi:hypothetical protein
MNDFESKNSPDDPLAGALDRWANDSAGYQPFDPAMLATSPKRDTVRWRAAATLAAAAMFLFALSQVSFTISMGDTTLQWGTIVANESDELSVQLAETESRIALFENQLSTHVEAINTVAAQNAMLGESLNATAIELVQRQEMESAARIYDMRNLAQLVSYEQ